MPLWKDIIRVLVNRLYPAAAFTDVQRRDVLTVAGAASGALRLAEEYEAAFGRQELDRLLLQLIPDDDYRPGPLHELLLRLPWSDVLTTNCDTLLEKGAARIIERRYDVIRTIQEIPRAMRPRIVKLHGTFPANGPFIFTEEDFRTYPSRFAAFVNLAQQTIMENIVCLLGFSGDDPNFLFWTGWVRDRLGSAAPQIYLCGILNVNDAQRRLLYRRNVTPIDVSPLFPPVRFPDRAMRHRLATEWFLLSLEAGRPADPFTWPWRSTPPLTPPSSGELPPILPRSGPELQLERMIPDG
jgi:hypothetical protein